MASDNEDFAHFISIDGHIDSPSLIAPKFDVNNNSEDEYSDLKNSEEPASAVNPETGEINWDCPCLKSALEPPCGHTFKAAFSCFVASKTEPKGIDCHELFKAMQECFQAHPEKYGAILEEDEIESVGIENEFDELKSSYIVEIDNGHKN